MHICRVHTYCLIGLLYSNFLIIKHLNITLWLECFSHIPEITLKKNLVALYVFLEEGGVSTNRLTKRAGKGGWVGKKNVIQK